MEMNYVQYLFVCDAIKILNLLIRENAFDIKTKVLSIFLRDGFYRMLDFALKKLGFCQS